MTDPSPATAPGPEHDLGPTDPAAVTGPAVPVSEHTDLRAVLDAAAGAPCPTCGTADPAGPDGFCPSCGQHRPAPRDHVDLRLGGAAGLTDRGLRRRRNEDAVALGRTSTVEGELVVGVVCDGVASARRGDDASLAAVEAAVDAALAEAARGTDLDGVAAAAAEGAARAAAGLGRASDGADPPACTYVGAVVRDGTAVVSWVGDSRIYWLADDGSAQLLSTDDSWAEEIAAAGLMSRDDAHADRRAHVLTRWLGADSPTGPARSRRVRVATPGMLMLCSDGVWNHVPDAAVLARLVRGQDAMEDARALVGAALDDGGYDNATVALLPMTPADDTEGFEVAGTGSADADTGPIPIPTDPGSRDPA